ncbi:hypothetical protein RF683_02925 [Flavobacterium sp. 20NA77.7]|uniref:Peptidyl-prolyl cis-trans isomerase n=1 Tax=Flavobacterium nakdongensis TaxID=3073563 RepID=A0ABY9RDM9_9FLAO|nr:hypothetical protein [Flavobacterium sp. 20NA77.7]WMW78415.1 hypothetical protein RF683_02925 [Flavobacterium sp. 20NA77.7]
MKRVVVLVGIIFLLGCAEASKGDNSDAIARVNDAYLYPADIQNLVPAGTSKKDSITLVKDFITRWATQQLLMNKAEKNVNKTQQQEFEELINQYKIDLYTKAYLEGLVQTKIDTLITEQEIETYYQKNKTNFRATEPLVKMRYINLVKGSSKFSAINTKFSRFSKKDKQDLQKQAIQFKSYALNDSLWIDSNQVYEKLPFINQENRDKYIASGMAYQYTDSSSVWLVKVKDMINKNNILPLQYCKPTIKQILLNNRKTDLINKIQKEITNDAIKDNDFEIFK